MKVVEGFERVLLVVSPKGKWVKSVLPSRRVRVEEVIVKGRELGSEVVIRNGNRYVEGVVVGETVSGNPIISVVRVYEK